MAQDRLLEVLQRGARVEPKLVPEDRARLAVDSECLGLPARRVERPHQRTSDTLPERMLANDLLELADDVTGPAELELRLDPLLERSDAKLLESADQRLRRLLSRQVVDRGDENVHTALNLGTTPVEFWATYLVPGAPGSAFRLDSPDPGWDF